MSNPQSQYRQYRCDIRGCRRFFDGKVGLKDHLERDHEGRLICAVESCNTSFTRIQDMRRHVHNLHEDGKEKCPHCSSQMRKDKMKAHKEFCAPPTAITDEMAYYDGGQFTSKVSLYLSEGAAQTAVSSDGSPNDSQRGALIDGTTEHGYYYEQDEHFEQFESWITPHINSHTVTVQGQGHEQGGMRLGYNDCLQEKEICEETS